MLELKLTKEQNEHLKTVMWLIAGPLRTGRTYLLAVGYVQYAFHHPNELVYIKDHSSMRNNNTALRIQIATIVNSDKDLKGTFRFSKHGSETIKYVGHKDL